MGEGEDAKLPSDFPGSSGLTFEDDGEVKRRVKSYSGTATSTDIVIASRAYIAALNRLLASEHEGRRRSDDMSGCVGEIKERVCYWQELAWN